MSETISASQVKPADQKAFLKGLVATRAKALRDRVAVIIFEGTGQDFSHEVTDLISLSNGGGYLRPSGRIPAQGQATTLKLLEQFQFTRCGQVAKMNRDTIGMVATYLALLELEGLRSSAATKETIGLSFERLAVYATTDLGPFADQPETVEDFMAVCHGAGFRN